MKKLLSSFLIITVLQVFFIFILLPNKVLSQTQEKLTNQNIIDLVKAGYSNELIILKIQSSANTFDTSITALEELKNNNVPDALIVVMFGGNKSEATKTQEVEITIPDGTNIEVALKNDLSGQYAKVGDIVHFTVVRDVQINGVTIIEKDASAIGKIAVAKKAGYWGKKGAIGWIMQDVMTAGGERIPVKFTKNSDGESKGTTVAVATVATAVLLLPIAPVALLWGLKKGQPAVISAGNYYSVYVDGTVKIKIKTQVK
jgi:hypothetical protein